MSNNYNFKDAQFDVKSLIHLFNLQGKDLIGLELGVLRAESFCSILQNCPNVKTLYGVDSWKPYTDILGEPYSMTEQQQEMHKFTAQHLIKYSGLKDKAVIIEKDSVEASKEIAYSYTMQAIDKHRKGSLFRKLISCIRVKKY